ncbi:hypothetical protein Hanom_Chr14g01309251 [Helianthus anomalus]
MLKMGRRRGQSIKSSDEGVEIKNPPGLLVLEYFERASPFQREPLASKISAYYLHKCLRMFRKPHKQTIPRR